MSHFLTLKMINNSLKKIIQKKIKKGYPIGELKNELIRDGYSLEEINSCFKTKKTDMQSWYLFFGILFSVAGIYSIMKYNSLLLNIAGVGLLVLYFKEKN